MPINRTLNEFRKKWGLPPLHSPNDSFSTVAQLCQMPRQFDFPRRELPTNFHYVGPFVDSKLAGQDPPFPFERLDGRPLIYASFGTLQPGAKPYFERIAEACLGLEAQLVITTGKTDGKMPEFPGNAIVVPYAPQMQLLSRAALTITHGGLNTTMQSLYFGVPMIAIPMTHDQPAIAARIKWTGSGIVIPPRQLSVGRLRESIKSVMGDGRYRAAAAVLRQAIEQSGGVDRAADIVERCLEPNRLGAAPRQRSSTEQPSNPKEECVSVS